NHPGRRRHGRKGFVSGSREGSGGSAKQGLTIGTPNMSKNTLTRIALGIMLGFVTTVPAFAADNPAFPVKVNDSVYPPPEYRYPNAKIGVTYKDSKPDFPPTRSAPEGAPNVLLVLVDDVGFGFPSVTGGAIKTPTAERLAANGITYCAFHTTALCSPTRSPPLTGRNHHS